MTAKRSAFTVTQNKNTIFKTQNVNSKKQEKIAIFVTKEKSSKPNGK